MPEINKKWIVSQMEQAKLPKPVGDAVMSLLGHWEGLKLSDEHGKQSAEVFYKLASTIALVEESSDSEVWVPARPGSIKVGDTMMVLPDAYDNPELAPIHNGRRGRVVRISYGNIVLAYNDGKEPAINMAHHSPFKLKKLVQG